MRLAFCRAFSASDMEAAPHPPPRTPPLPKPWRRRRRRRRPQPLPMARGHPAGPPARHPHRRAEAGSPSRCHRPGVGRKRSGSGGPDAASRAQEGGGSRRGPFLLPRRLETARAGRAGGRHLRAPLPPERRGGTRFRARRVRAAQPDHRARGGSVCPPPPHRARSCPRRPRLRPDALDTAPRVPRGGLFTSAAGRGGGVPVLYTYVHAGATSPGDPHPASPMPCGGRGPAPGGPLSSLGREGRGKQGVLGGVEGPGRGHQRPKCHQTASRACPQRRRGKERPRVRRGGRVGGLRGGRSGTRSPRYGVGSCPLSCPRGVPAPGGCPRARRSWMLLSPPLQPATAIVPSLVPAAR